MTIKNKSFVALSLGVVLSSQSMIIPSASQVSSDVTVLSDDEVNVKINTGISTQVDPEISKTYSMGEIDSISTFSTKQLNLSVKELSNPEAIGCGSVTATNLNIRSGPSSSNSVVGTLKLNDKVEILSKTNNWYKIDYNGKDAYVICSYIKLNPIEKGIDVSKWNGNIDWTSVKNSGIDYVIIRAGYGTSTVDPQFENYIQGASNAGLKVGVYWFSYATSPENAKIEAQSCLNTISKYKNNINYPVFFDFEYDSVTYAKNKGVNVTKSLATEIAQSFLSTVKSSGYSTGIYTNNDFGSTYFSDDLHYANNLWIAQYGSTNTFKKPYSMWQYSETGSVDGIKTKVDLNYTCLKFDITPKKGITTANINFRQGPSTSYDKIDLIPKNSTIEVLDSSNDWYKVKYNNKIGYVYGIYVDLNSDTSSSSNNTLSTSYSKGVTTNNLNFRKKASTSSLIINTIPKNTTVEILEKQSYGWYKIKYKGLTGYVSGIYIK